MARPQQYDRQKVSDQAMHLFWHQGYQATPVSDLVRETGVRPGSLYSAFGNKEGLLLAALQEYTDQIESVFLGLFARCQTAREGVEALLQGIIDDAVSGTASDGCLLINTLLEMSGHNSRVCDAVNKHLARVENCFYELLIRARNEGSISEDAECKELALFLMGTVWSLRIMSRVVPVDPQRMQALVKPAIKTLFN